MRSWIHKDTLVLTGLGISFKFIDSNGFFESRAGIMQGIQNAAYSCDGNICHFRYGFQTGSVPQQIGDFPSKTVGPLKISGRKS